jgi:hypothetical protein
LHPLSLNYRAALAGGIQPFQLAVVKRSWGKTF